MRLTTRNLFRGRGAHRRCTREIHMQQPIEAQVNDLAWCPAEDAQRLHAFLATGGRICWTCRTVTVDPTPRGGVE